MKRDPVLALLVIWSLFIFFFFSLAQSKLAGYLLPVLPGLWRSWWGPLSEEVLGRTIFSLSGFELGVISLDSFVCGRLWLS